MKDILSKNIIIPALLIAVLYVMATIYLMNAGLVKDAIFGAHSLIYKRTLRSSGKIHLAVGGSSLLGIVGSGCASCGLPILALIGLSGAMAYLPFRGIELSVIAIALLGSSLYFLLRSRSKGKVCEVNNLFTQKI